MIKDFFLLNISDNDNVKISFAYVIDSLHIWYGRLGHANFAYNKKMRALSF